MHNLASFKDKIRLRCCLVFTGESLNGSICGSWSPLLPFVHALVGTALRSRRPLFFPRSLNTAGPLAYPERQGCVSRCRKRTRHLHLTALPFCALVLGSRRHERLSTIIVSNALWCQRARWTVIIYGSCARSALVCLQRQFFPPGEAKPIDSVLSLLLLRSFGYLYVFSLSVRPMRFWGVCPCFSSALIRIYPLGRSWPVTARDGGKISIQFFSFCLVLSDDRRRSGATTAVHRPKPCELFCS